MIKTGYLLHVYNLETQDWERLVWGDPSADLLGCGTKFIECLLSEPADNPVCSIIYSGPSTKDGLTEGAYTKRFLLQKLDSLREFPRLAKLIDGLSSVEYDAFVKRVNEVVLGKELTNTLSEVTNAAEYFTEQGVGMVVQVATATHAPRCVQCQTVVRGQGKIPAGQQWFVAASDICFAGATPEDVVVIEPPHRGDDPMRAVRPTLAHAIKPYFGYSTADKTRLISRIVQETSDISNS